MLGRPQIWQENLHSEKNSSETIFCLIVFVHQEQFLPILVKLLIYRVPDLQIMSKCTSAGRKLSSAL